MKKWSYLIVGLALGMIFMLGYYSRAAGTVCQIFNGCTATSTLPGYGKVLVGNSSGTAYDYVSTSTFGSVSSVTGTNNQITASPSTGAIILSVPSLFSISLASTTGLSALGNLYSGSGAATTTIRGGATSTFLGGITISSSDATSTFDKGLSAFAINISGSATSTASNGFDLSGGCWSISGVCLQTIISSASAYKQAVKYASTSTLPANTYNNGASGVGATITGTALQPLFIDGNTAALGDRILVKNEGTGANNGIYTVTTAGVGGVAAFVLTRATDYNSSLDVFPGVASFTNSGTVNANTCWILTNTSAVTIGVTALTYNDACGAGSFTGTYPITFSGTTISLAFGTTTSNIWSGIQTFTNASTTNLSVLTLAAFGATATSSFNSAGVLTLATPLAIGSGGTGTTTMRNKGVIYSDGTSLRQASSTGLFDYDPTQQNVTIQSASTTNLTVGTGLIPGFFYPAFSYATSTAYTGTTTIQLGIATIRETWTSVQCATDAGTLNVQFYNGTNKLNMLQASTTIGTYTFSTNNKFTATTKRSVDIGTPASTPTYLSCTVKKSYDP